jgi:predicted Fe-S protein YdhL (DUF1289 family)
MNGTERKEGRADRELAVIVDPETLPMIEEKRDITRAPLHIQRERERERERERVRGREGEGKSPCALGRKAKENTHSLCPLRGCGRMREARLRWRKEKNKNRTDFSGSFDAPRADRVRYVREEIPGHGYVDA